MEFILPDWILSAKPLVVSFQSISRYMCELLSLLTARRLNTRSCDLTCLPSGALIGSMYKPTSSELLKAAKIRDQIEKLEAEYSELLSGSSSSRQAAPKKKKRKLSAKARARIAEAQRRRWAKVKRKQAKKAAKKTSRKSAKKKARKT